MAIGKIISTSGNTRNISTKITITQEEISDNLELNEPEFWTILKTPPKSNFESILDELYAGWANEIQKQIDQDIINLLTAEINPNK